VNGTPSFFFSSTNGLRQGDPLSLILFTVVMEALSRVLIATMEKGLLTSFLVGSRNNEELVVSNLLFADDTLIFCDANPLQIQYLRHLFFCFEEVSRLRINLAK
jgi:hypothetical protein